MPTPELRRKAGTILIWLGVLAWAPYFYLDKIVGQDVIITPFLAAHLTGVLGGAALRASVEVEHFTRRGGTGARLTFDTHLTCLYN